jgi:APA family basic amino acid/polyamine antiporter
MNFLRKKSFTSAIYLEQTTHFNKNLNAIDLILLGLGGIIGTGVFVLTGIVSANYAGPAIMLSYAISGIICIFVALSYAELATMLPSAGTIYTYAYVALGEVFAWLIGSVIILEIGFSSATVSAGWSAYTRSILHSAGLEFPQSLSKIPSDGGIMDLLAFLIPICIGSILYFGSSASKGLTNVLVSIKLAAIFIFILFAAPHFDATNWNNFMPFGFDGITTGASILFFAFTGFALVASAAEECKEPKRDLIIGIVGSLIISTIVYIIVAGLLTGIISFDKLNNAQPLAYALKFNNCNIGSALVATGAICGITTVLMVNLYAQSRIFYVIARDGLLPRSLAKLHSKYKSPYITIMIFALFAAILGAFCPYHMLAQLSSMGSLIHYSTVSLIVIIFRFTLPLALRPFKCPYIFVIAPIAFVACIYLLFKQILDNKYSLLITGKLIICWFVIMFILYVIRFLFLRIVNKT